MRKRKKRCDKKGRVTNLGEEYDTVLELSAKLGTYRDWEKTKCLVVDLRTGKRKTVCTGQPSTINRQSVTDYWFVTVPGTSEDDVLLRVLTALRITLRYVIRKGRGRPKHARRLKSVVPRTSYDAIRAALTATGKAVCTNRHGDGFTVELFVPKWTGWTIRDVYGLSGEAVEIDVTPCNKPVLQLDKKTGEVIRRFDGVREAARVALNETKNPGRIVDCCNGKRKSFLGYGWRYAEGKEYV